jgi:hypothetical protein
MLDRRELGNAIIPAALVGSASCDGESGPDLVAPEPSPVGTLFVNERS